MIEYRIAEKEHIPGILALYPQLVPNDEPTGAKAAEEIWEKGRSQGVTHFVAMEGERVVSALYLAVIPNLSRGGKSNGFIENVVTDAEYRRRGIGKKLIQMALDYARENNCYKAVLLSNAKHKDAHQFYESCGFDGISKKGFVFRFDQPSV